MKAGAESKMHRYPLLLFGPAHELELFLVRFWQFPVK